MQLSQPLPSRTRSLLWILLALIAAGSMWSYVLIVWPESARELCDLYPRWYGSRELLLHGRDPYSSDVSREIQIWLRGRPAAPGEDENRFAYPVYVTFLLAPTVRSDFDVVNKTMLWLLALFSAASVILYLSFLDWWPSRMRLATILLLSIGSFPVVFGARARQLALISGLLIALCLALIAKRRFAWAGIFLALATIKPQLTFLLAGWLLLWAISNWRSRQAFFWSFLASIAALSAGSELLVRGWIPEFVRATAAYVRYTDGRSILQLFLTRPGGSVVATLLIVVLGVFCWQHRVAKVTSSTFHLCTALVLSTTLIVIPTVAPHGQVLLLLAMFFLLKNASAIWDSGRLPRHAYVATWLLIAWQWIAAFGVSIAAMVSGINLTRKLWLVPLSTSPVLPVVVSFTLAIAAKRISSSRDHPLAPDKKQKAPTPTI